MEGLLEDSKRLTIYSYMHTPFTHRYDFFLLWWVEIQSITPW